MFTGLQGQKIMYTTSFVGKVCRKNPGFDKDKTDVMFGVTLYDFASFIFLCTSKGIKDPFENKNNGPRSKKLGHPTLIILSLSPSPSPSLFFSGWSLGTWRLPAFTFLPGFLRSEREDVLCLHSLGRPGGHLWPLWTGQTPCLGVLLVFYVNQGISASFSPLFSYLQHSFLISL